MLAAPQKGMVRNGWQSPPIQKLKRDAGVRRMLAAPQPTRREKESKEHVEMKDGPPSPAGHVYQAN